MAVAGHARVPGGAEAVLERFGAITRLIGIRYWSASAQSWQTLILDAHAVAGAADARHRPNFAAQELRDGREVFFSQTDNDAGTVLYRMRVMSATDSRIVITLENAGTIRRFMLALFGPGELQSVYVLDRGDQPDIWSFYSLTRAAPGASGLTDGHESSSVNRAVAFFRHIAGLPTDQEPPAARR